MSYAAAKSEAADPSRRDHTGWNHEPVCRGCCIDLAELRSALDSHCGCFRIDTDSVHRREIEHEPFIDASEPSAVVPAGSNREPQLALLREPDRGRDILLVEAVHNRGGMFVDHRVVESARLVIAGLPSSTTRPRTTPESPSTPLLATDLPHSPPARRRLSHTHAGASSTR